MMGLQAHPVPDTAEPGMEEMWTVRAAALVVDGG